MLHRLRGKDERERQLRQLTRSCKRLMQTQDRQVKGITDIVFTVGGKETNEFKSKNEACRARGESYFVRVKNDIGSKEKMVVIWIKVTSQKDEFLTDLKLSSTQPNHQHFFFGDKEGYKLVVHPEMRGMSASDPSLCLWFKKETTKSRYIADIRVTYTNDDQIDLSRKNYEKLPQCLSNFSLGYANIWVLTASSSTVRLTDCDHIEKELKDYEDMLSKNPEDEILAEMVDKAKWRLREAQLAEEDHAKDIPGDDMTYTKEFLAMRSRELRKMRSIFRKSIDHDRDGRISIEDFCMFIREPLSMSPFIRQIFTFSAPANGKLATYPIGNDAPVIDAGSTLKAVAVFCMLGSSELMKFLFAWYDTKGWGVIENKQFLDLLGLFHPRHRDDVVVRALKDIQLSADEKMSYSRFESDCKKFPHLL